MPLIGQKLKGVADIVICVDSTGSMAPVIDKLKAEIHRFITDLESPPEQNLQAVDWRLRVIGFRDLDADGSGGWVHRDAPLVNTAADARAQIDRLAAEGGGDEPESGLDAIWSAAAKTSWRRPCTRIIVFFSDASAHPRLHRSTVAEGAVADDASAVAQAVVENSCYLHAWAPHCPPWDILASVPRVHFTALTSAGDGLSSINFGELMVNLRKTVSQTASESLAGGNATMPLS